jgi:arylsulfatase A-like enzyme
MQDVRPEDLAASIALYDGAIAYVDDQIGRLLDGLSRLGRREHTIVVVTADHGDEFLDHGGMGHGTTVYGELVRVPLVISAPWILGAPRRIATLSRHVDLAPTLLDFAGVARPAEFRGKTLLEPAPVAFTEDGPWRGVYANGHKLVVNTKTKARQQFGLDDVRDQTPLGGDPDPALVDQLAGYERVRDARKARGHAEGGPSWSPEELERLRALGYAR